MYSDLKKGKGRAASNALLRVGNFAGLLKQVQIGTSNTNHADKAAEGDLLAGQ